MSIDLSPTETGNIFVSGVGALYLTHMCCLLQTLQPYFTNHFLLSPTFFFTLYQLFFC